MPTSTGMPKLGEKVWLRNADDTWAECFVTRREGRSSDYSLWVTRTDGRAFPGTGTTRIVTEVPWWIRQGTIRLTAPPEARIGGGTGVLLERTIIGPHKRLNLHVSNPAGFSLNASAVRELIDRLNDHLSWMEES